jgi:hypothetical protein
VAYASFFRKGERAVLCAVQEEVVKTGIATKTSSRVRTGAAIPLFQQKVYANMSHMNIIHQNSGRLQQNIFHKTTKRGYYIYE